MRGYFGPPKMAATSLTIGATGTVAIRTTVLPTPGKGDGAVQRRPPIGPREAPGERFKLTDFAAIGLAPLAERALAHRLDGYVADLEPAAPAIGRVR